MNTKKFSEAMGELDSKYVDEAIRYKREKAIKKPGWVKWGAMAACLCLMVAGGVMLTQNSKHIAPNPQMVQVPDPFITVTSIAEMEEYLDFDVPVLDKEVKSYSVLIDNSYPVMGQIDYADGSEFRIQYGSGDISGIYGGTLEESKDIDGVKVEYYKYTDTTYAIWEQNGFTFSYVYIADGISDVEKLIQQCK